MLPRIVQPRFWQVGRQRQLPLDRPRLLGILNVTPDSFSDGGAYANAHAAVEAALRMHAEGADIIDIGGESTRPGAAAISPEEQMRRAIPVIELLRRAIGSDKLLISIDTTRQSVANAALSAGADIINDQSAGLDDEGMLTLAASRGCGIILMHRRVHPSRDVFSTQYANDPDYGGDVVAAVREFLARRAEAAERAGIDASAIVIDPGLGFGKSVRQNQELAGRIGELGALSYAVLSAASRKSFIGAMSGESVAARRVAGTIALSVAHCLAGIRLFRVHDVAAHHQALAVAGALGGGAAASTAPTPLGG